MARATFYILDVFAERRYAGNQLAVFRHAEGIPEAEMQELAREINFSETTFIISEKPSPNGYGVRIFTPKEEVPFAGHPTLGTAYVIQQEIIRQPVKAVLLDLKLGQIPVTFSYQDGRPDVLWMKQQAPTFGQRLDATAVAEVIGLSESDIDARFPIEEVSTGLPAIIVPLRSLRALKQAVVDKARYFELIAKTIAKTLLVFAPEARSRENQLSVRVFVDYYGIPEDPATGSGNGCLAGYLARHRCLGANAVDVRVEQGYEIGRPSLLYLKSSVQGESIDVSVGGKALIVARGEWL